MCSAVLEVCLSQYQKATIQVEVRIQTDCNLMITEMNLDVKHSIQMTLKSTFGVG